MTVAICVLMCVSIMMMATPVIVQRVRHWHQMDKTVEVTIIMSKTLDHNVYNYDVNLFLYDVCSV